MPPKSGIKAPIQLLVEGADARFFFMHYLNHLGFNNVEVQEGVEWRGHSRVYREAPDLIVGLGLKDRLDAQDLAAFNRVREAILARLNPSVVEIKDFGGNENLRNFLMAFWSMPRARTAVNSIGIIRDAESDAQAAFASAQGAVRDLGLVPPESPLQVTDGSPKVGILILPPERPKGILENLCLDSVKDDPAMPCVQEYLECLQEKIPHWPSGNLKKAHVHAFLASRPEPGMKLGEGARLGYWNWNHTAFRPIERFIRDLIGP